MPTHDSPDEGRNGSTATNASSVDNAASASSLQELVGRCLRTYRQRQRLTQERVADLLGFDVRYVRRIEKGQMNLQLQRIDHITRTFGMDPLEFLLLARVAAA